MNQIMTKEGGEPPWSFTMMRMMMMMGIEGVR